MMKKFYVAPEVSEIVLGQEDILTLSIGNGNNLTSISWKDLYETPAN